MNAVNNNSEAIIQDGLNKINVELTAYRDYLVKEVFNSLPEETRNGEFYKGKSDAQKAAVLIGLMESARTLTADPRFVSNSSTHSSVSHPHLYPMMDKLKAVTEMLNVLNSGKPLVEKFRKFQEKFSEVQNSQTIKKNRDTHGWLAFLYVITLSVAYILHAIGKWTPHTFWSKGAFVERKIHNILRNLPESASHPRVDGSHPPEEPMSPPRL